MGLGEDGVGEGSDCLINVSSGFDEDDEGSRALEREDEVVWGVLAGYWEVSFDGDAIQGFIYFGCGSFVDRDWEAFLGNVQGEVLAHYGETGEADSGQNGIHQFSRERRVMRERGRDFFLLSTLFGTEVIYILKRNWFHR